MVNISEIQASTEVSPIPDHLLYYQTYQNPLTDQWLLMVHGAGGSTRTWKRQLEDFSAQYNLLIIDLPGHGNNAGRMEQLSSYSFEIIARKVWEVVDYLKIPSVHLVGVSLGAIICLQMRVMQPQRVLSAILPGAIVQLNTKLKILANLSLGLAKIIGYRNFYNLSAHIMMPRGNHKQSRDVFIKESKALTINEFRKWTALYFNLNNKLKELFNATSDLPHYLIMGEQDHLFLPPAKTYAQLHSNASLSVISNCGHVVSIEQAGQFNQLCLKFLNEIK